jgi:hypothetical protein
MESSEQSKPKASTYNSLSWQKKTVEWPDAWPGTVPTEESKSASLYLVQDRMNRKQIQK